MNRKVIFGLLGVLAMGLAKNGWSADGIAPKAEAVHPLAVGHSVPDGIVTTLEGKQVHLKSLMDQKLTILIFYRGGWCPFCNLQMGQLVKLEPDLAKLGFQVLAVSPDQPNRLKESLDKHHINYTLLSDSHLTLAREFGLAYHVNAETLARMKEHGVDLEAATGNSLHLLPVPAAYVVDRKGIVRFLYFNPDIKVRVDPGKLLKAAQEAAKS
ncbi:MAG: peroxiredoxin-like family protein [bacterium]